MGQHLNFEFTAPAGTLSIELERFLQSVLEEVAAMGFEPAIVLNVPFDTPERQEFARRSGGGRWVEDERLKTGIPREDHVIRQDSFQGDCRVAPLRGVVLVLTDEKGAESCFGFMQYPEQVKDRNGETLAKTLLQGRWVFRDFISSADPRYRRIVERFRSAGYVKEVADDYAEPLS